MLSLEELRRLAGPHAAAIDERTRDQMHEVANSVVDRFEAERRQATQSSAKAPPSPFLRLVPVRRHDEAEELAAIREFEGGQRRDEAERGTLHDLGLRGGE